jgi:GAF domain-containing protein
MCGASQNTYAARLNRQHVTLVSSLQAVVSTRRTESPLPIDAIAPVVADAAKTLEVDRMALWRYDKGLSRMQCIHVYRRTTHDPSMVVGQIIHPPSSYLERLREGHMILVDNMTLDVSSRFQDVHLDSPERISVLDAPIRQDTQLLGVISCLSIGTRRIWHDDDKAFVELLTKILVLAFGRNERG